MKFRLFSVLILLLGSQSVLFSQNDITLLDVMIIYTPAAESMISQPVNTPIKEWINEAVTATNQALKNSEARLRIDLVHTQKVNYLEKDNTTDLTNLTQGVQGLESVSQWQDYYHADIVILVTSNRQGGRAQSLMSIESDLRCSRFAVVQKSSTSVFVHEFGHLLGAQHDEMLKGKLTKAIYPYAHGYTAGAWLPNTIVGGFKEVKNGIGKIAFYSNPDLSYRKQALGDVNTGNNVRTFNATAPFISECKSSVVTWTGAISDRWTDSRNWSNNYLPRSIDDVDIPMGLSRYPVISSGQQYARSLVVDRGARLTITAGNLLVRNTLIASGDLIATGGTIQMLSIADLSSELRLSKATSLANLIIGDGKKAAWVKAGSAINIKNDLVIEPNAILDPADNLIRIEGDLKGQGNGLSTNSPNLNVVGSTETQKVILNFPIAPTNDGFYISERSGFSSMIELGNSGYNWSFGGAEGQAMLDTRNSTYMDDPRYMNATDSWIFTPAVLLQKGINYQVSFDAKTGKYSEPFNYSVHLGSIQLPSKMKLVVDESLSRNNDEWAAFGGNFKVNNSGWYHLGIRATIPDTKYENKTFVRTIQIQSTKSESPDDEGCASRLGQVKFTDFMPLGSQLNEGERLLSQNGKYQLRFDPKEVFVIEQITNEATCATKKIWSTRPLNFPVVSPPAVTHLKFQEEDGNVCVISKLGSAYCFTDGRDEFKSLLYNSEQLQLTDDGRLVILNKSGAEVWSNRPPLNRPSEAKVKYETVMRPGDVLTEGESLVSANKQYQLRANEQDQLVIEKIDIRSGRILQTVWQAPFTGRNNRPNDTNRIQMNMDCNFCFTSRLQEYFCITTGRDDKASILYQCGEITLTNNGHLILYSAMGEELWRSH